MKNFKYAITTTLIALSFILGGNSHLVAQNAVSEQTVLDNMLALIGTDPQARAQACKWLAESKDLAVAPALVDALYFIEMPREWDWAIGQVTGKTFGRDWSRWMEWLGRQNFIPHPAYAKFKQVLFGRVDPSFGVFLSPKHPHTIRLDEIVWGGVKKDGIPALDNPKMIPASQAGYLNGKDEVFGLSVNGAHHAYPLRILNWHEMLNIGIGGTAISLTYCTLCGAAVPYEGTVGDTTFTFGSSGLLYRSNKLMYDRQTISLWSSLHGEPVLGPLVGKNIQLERHYVVRTNWEKWHEQHPETLVLDIDTGFDRDYSPKSAYEDYFKSSETMFPVSWRDKRLKAKDWIYGIIWAGQPKAYPLKRLKKVPVLNDSIGEHNIVLLSDEKYLTVRAYERGNFTFSDRNADTGNLVDANGDSWRTEEESLVRTTDQVQLARLPGHLAYWFGWYAFFPQTEVWNN